MRNGHDRSFGYLPSNRRTIGLGVALSVLTVVVALVGAAPPGSAAGETCGGLAATIVGTPADDVLTGTPGSDVIVGGAGDDVIKGLGGDDYLCGNGGDDRLVGGTGKDRLWGNKGADVIKGGGGKDKLVGGAGPDVLAGGGRRDVLKGQGGDDILKGQAGNDLLLGGAGDDVLSGGAGTDVAKGGKGTDECTGSETTESCENIGDGISWTKHPGNPVLDTGPGGAWDSELVGEARVATVEDGYFMVYAGQDGTTDGSGGVSPFFGYGLGVATSPDGITWERSAMNPFVTLDGGQFGMFWHGLTVVGDDFRSYYALGDDIGGRIGYRIYLATSSDGETWATGPDPVLDLGPTDGYDGSDVLAPSLLVEGGTYKMWYNAIDTSGSMTIAYATSSDGLSWEKHPGNPVLDLGPGAADPYYPAVLKVGGTYMMWFGGAGGIYLATSTDGIAWSMATTGPILTPGGASDWDSESVYEPTVLFDGEVYHMWFTGSSGPFVERIGYATSP